MTHDVLTATAARPARLAAIALGASIPISTALDNVLLGIMLLAWLLAGAYRDTLKILLKNKVLQCSSLLLGLLVLGTLYGESTNRDAINALGKYADLLFIPLFALIFQDASIRVKALHVLAISLAVTVLLSYLTLFGLRPAWPVFTGDATDPTVFKLRTAHNFLVAFGAFLFAWLAVSAATRRMQLAWGTLAILAAVNVLFMVQGATGYVILGTLMLLFIAQRYGWRGLALACAGLAIAFTALVSLPSKFQARIQSIQQEITQWRIDEPATTSSGHRLEFYRNTLDIIAAHPLAGVGTGGFPQAYAKQVQGTGKLETHNPHNEFLHLAAQIGILGALALVALFWVQWRSARHLDTPMTRGLAQGLVVTMVIGCMVNSLLFDHTEGLFYAWLTGLLFASYKHSTGNATGVGKY